MWECTWNKIEKAANLLLKGQPLTPELVTYNTKAQQLVEYKRKCYVRPFQNAMYVSEGGMRQSILSGAVFGFAKVCVRCKPEYRQIYEEFPPVIKKVEINLDDIGEYMRQIAMQHGKLQKGPQTALVGSYFGEGIWLSTPMIIFLHNHGVEIEKIWEIAQFDKESDAPFAWFGEEVTRNRRLGDIDPIYAIIAELWKLLGNAAYGKTITNILTHMIVFYADKLKASEMNNDPFHSRTIPIGDDESCYEIQCRPSKHTFALPNVIGLSVYSYAKIRMLEFIYDCLIPFLDRDKWTIVESDTDSCYMAIAGDSIDDIVLSERRDEWNQKIKPAWFVDETKPDTKRQPGLFKLEKETTLFAALSPKCYVLADKDGKQYPKSKGCQLSSLNASALTFENYKKVLLGEATAATNVHNVSIRTLPSVGLASTIVEKHCLSPFSCKRIYDEFGDSTPLNI